MKKKSNIEYSFIGKLRFVLLIMRLTLFLLLGFTFVVQANSYSQATKFSMSIKNATVEDVFREIESNSEFIIFFQDQHIDLNRKVKMKVRNQGIENVLEQLFEGTNNQWEIDDRQIMIYRELLELESREAMISVQPQETRKISGTVVDNEGIPIPGASIFIKGTNTGTTSDLDGSFTLEVPTNTKTIVVSFIGMETQEVIITDRNAVNITLLTSTTGLSEVVVTALGIKREAKSLGYAASRVGGVELAKSSAPNIVNALSGKTAGVFITNPNSIEGGSTRITLRGNTSLAGGNTPLIIVDGMPYANESDATSATSNRDYGSALNQIEAMDIESIDILKGTAASALYGSRGANGVIIITTKKGEGKDGMKVEYSLNTKISDPYRFQEFQNEYGYGGPGGNNGILWKIPKLGENHPNTWGDAYGIIPAVKANGQNYQSWDYAFFSWYGTNSSWGPKLDGTMIEWWDGEQRPWSPQPDNMSLFYKNGTTTTHNLSLSSNSKFGNFRVSVSLKDNEAIIEESGFKSTNIYIGGNLNLGDKLKAEVFTTYNRRDLTNPPLLGQTNDSFTNIFYNLPRNYKALEWENYKNPDGSRNNQAGWGYWINKHIGWNFHENEFKQYLNQMRSYVKLHFTPTDWLSLSGSAGLDFTSEERQKLNGFTDGIGLVNNSYNHRLTRTYSPNLDFLATIHKDDITEGLNASLSFGGQSWKRSMYYIEGDINRKAKSPYINSFANYETDPNANQARPREGRYDKQINSLFGFMDVSYKDFLYLQVTARNDWSSTLPVENNNYFYPGASLSFIPSEIFNLGEAVSFAKLRFAYAQTGSDTNPYQVTPTYKPDSWGKKPTVSMKDGLPNIDLKSQRSKEFEIGANVAFFENRLTVDFTYYNKHSFDQILSAPLPWSSGSNSIKFNSGELELKGLEYNINITAVQKQNLRWDIGIVGSKFSNKLLALTEGVEIFNIGGLWGDFGTTMKATVGEEFGAIYGWGIEKDSNGRPILNVFYDKDGEVTGTMYKKTEEQEIVGNATPKMIGGVNSTLSWKNLTLFTLIDYKWGGDVYNPQYGSSLIGGLSPATLKERNGGGLPYTYPSGETANIGVIMDGVVDNGDGKYVENTHVVHAYYKYGSNGWNPNPQPQAIMENSWVKLREVSLSYRLPSTIIDKVNFLQNVDVTLTGRDLFYIYDTMPDKINPEGTNGVGDANYVIAGALPGVRSFAFTLKATF